MRAFAFLAAAGAILTAQPAAAAAVTSLPGGAAMPLSAAQQFNGACCRNYTRAFDGGTFTADNSNLWGWTEGFDFLGDTPDWAAGGSPAAIAYGSGSTTMNFTLDAPVAGLLADFNWGGQSPFWGPLTISVFDASDILLESFVLAANGANSVVPGKYGFSRDQADISRLQVSGVYYGVRGISTTQGGAGAAPEPAAWALLILGFGAAGSALRRTRRQHPLAIG
jgi:hypothetical protein